MHSAAASEKLATIVEGESLLNDAVAYVLFEIFRGWAAGEKVTAGGTIAFVAKACLGSPALGAVWAVALVVWFVLIISDPIAEVAISLVAAYALWLVTDEMLHMSGILALVVFSTAIGASGKYRVS
jgi:NhaP-type Na+/H+ or K+/H+ antiporter